MEKYTNEKYLERTIMNQSRHLFIYGWNNDHRSDFLKRFEEDYPVSTDSNRPVALYFDSLGIPKQDISLSGKDPYLLNTSCREYLSFTVAAKILERSMEYDKDFAEEKLSKLVSLSNRNKKPGFNDINSVEELLKQYRASRDHYYDSLLRYIRGEIERISINEVAIPFMQLESFVTQYKRAMGMNSYFGIVYDKKGPLAIPSTRQINNLIGSRINGDISVKIAMEPENWETYVDSNGQFVQATHDYGTVELDDSFQKYMKKVKRNL